MEKVAAEMNLSETAFLIPGEEGYSLRWFTPTVEVDLCGHATLASAHILWEQGYVSADSDIRFHTRSGQLAAYRREDSIELDFPAITEEPAEAPAGLIEALGVRPLYIGQNLFDYLVQVGSVAEVRALEPDHAKLRNLNVRGVILTARSGASEFDFVSRFFAPGSGIDEDPVTGSAHCCLGPFWAEKLGKQDLIGFQASPRGGVVKVNVRGDRVLLGGRAVTILEGELV
jgi:PhzF family phenazine biosynthesis protein